MRCAVYPGSFDPITLGHLDIIERISHLFDKVYVAMLINKNKNYSVLAEKRLEMIQIATEPFENVVCELYSGLLAEYVQEKNVHCIVRGLRSSIDFDNELNYERINHELCGRDTLYLPARREYTHISSSAVRELIAFHGDISKLVPQCLIEQITAWYGGER